MADLDPDSEKNTALQSAVAFFLTDGGGEATPLLPPIPGSAPGSKLILKKNLFSRSTDDWLKDLERANRMRKHREKMKQADQKQQQTSTAEQIFHSYSSQQQEAYRKFEKEFVGRIDRILDNKVKIGYICRK